MTVLTKYGHTPGATLSSRWAPVWKAEWQMTAMASNSSSIVCPHYFHWVQLSGRDGISWELCDQEDMANILSGRLSDHISLSSEACSREYGAKWLRRKGRDLASGICQLVESDDTWRTIFFGIMSSLQPFYNHTVAPSTSADLPGSSPIATTG